MKIGFISLGCPKNLLDTEVMLSKIATQKGHEITADESEAEIVIVNTCAFIESAKKESIDNILDIAWLKKHGKCKGIIVTGCLSERYREEILKEFPEVDAVLGTGSYDKILEAIQSVQKKRKYTSFEDKNCSVLGGERVITTGDAYAYLKISEGCNNRCTYCAIPNIRGKFRSRPMDEIVAEAKELGSMGIKELIVIGQDTTAYGIDLYGEYRLAELLSRLAKETDVSWLRILYCYPDKITDELLHEFEVNDKLVKYIDIPIQHVSDTVLKRMNRRGNAQMIEGVMEKLRKIKGMVIRTTAIVGFPGETEEDFVKLCEFVKKVKFDKFGAFPYSREEDTPAYDFPDQIDEQVKQDRYDILMKEQADISEKINEQKIGQVLDVLVEDYDVVAETYYGRSYADAPEIDGKVFFSAEKNRYRAGDFVKIKITDAEDYDTYGELVK